MSQTDRPTQGEVARVIVEDCAFRAMVARFVLLAFLFAAELLVISVWLDTSELAGATGLTRLVGDWGPDILRGIVGFAAIFVTFAFLTRRRALSAAAGQITQTRFSWVLLAGHGGSLLAFVGLSKVVFTSAAAGHWNDSITAAWFIAGMVAIVFAALAFVPCGAWVQMVRTTGYLWAYAAASAILACMGGDIVRSLWSPVSYATFALSKLLLQFAVPTVVANPTRMWLGTPLFTVSIARECSGLEGAGLVLVFGMMWLLLFRHRCRFPHSLLLLPAAVGLSFLLNVVRITTLILIGHAGFQQIALRGFHSQAGWMFFSVVAVAFSMVIGRVPLFLSDAGLEARETAATNPAPAYLLPFLAILAAGLVASAATATVEWLYPLRFFAAAAVLWAYRRRYAYLNWRCGWLAVTGGMLVFAVWIALDRLTGAGIRHTMPSGLATASARVRFAWIAFRLLGSAVTVPIAEELAFRGFLLRRLLSSDFETVPFRSVTWPALLGSSALFGILHGSRWLAGSVAGLVFGWLVIRRGRMGDPVVAHAIANLLIGAYVLSSHDWSLW